MKLLILDGNSVINRAFYGVRLLTTREGLFTNAVFGFLNILERLEREEQPEAICVAFDLHGPTFRHEKYELYKANRHGMPEELAQQMPIMKDVLRAMNIPIYTCQGWEADDVIGTVGRICDNNGWECVIATGDRDSLQLVTENVHVKLIITKGGQTTTTLYTPEVFKEEYGFEPPKMVDLKSLMGDSSDNVPGVAGVGPKTASDLLVKFGSLDGIYGNFDSPDIKGKLRERLETGKDMAYLSYDLCTIRTNAPIDFAPEDAVIRPYNRSELYNLFVKLEFVKLIDKYGLRGAEPVKTLKAQDALVLPTLEALPEKCDGFALYLADDGTVAVACEKGCCQITPMEAAMADFSSWTGGICHDLKKTMHQLDAQGLEKPAFVFDTALAAYDLIPTQSDYPVSKLATSFLGQTVEDEDALACAKALWQLRPVLQEELVQNGMAKLYEEMELPLCSVLYRMENAGVAIDRNQLEQFGKMLTKRIADCEALIYGYADGPFNINSTKQLGDLLFEKLALPPMKKTKSGYSTNADVLEKIKHLHPIVPAVMDYRMLTKLKSTYADGLMKVICDDGRIRSTFQNLVTATGRLSSTDPNLQNIPVRTDLGAEIRKMFIPEEGNVLVDADYSQIELRVLAHIADDKVMQKAFIDGTDIHTLTASQVFDVPMEKVTPLQRRHAKAVNFGIVYGISEFSLSEDIGVSRYEAKRYIESYLENFSGVRSYMKNVVADARATGYTQTLYGRRRSIPDLKNSNFNVRQAAERVALNTPIQGTAADLIKLAMIHVDEALARNYPQAHLVLQVHDELIVECPEKDAEAVAALVSREMEQVASLKVPLTAEAKWGKSWYKAK